ncbi:Retrovirus-related Pol polyprotein from transposon TNT 1-94 [Durusdinium trenchii]|uniref:Retrovirus-related Pol polyprotein from transposon TNT 1-94 n=1 Tax=Durusdinium trenchii TaxID=1381693 RepID=A0ABP0RRB0_9DINO
MAPRLVQLQLPAVNPEEEEFEKQDTWKLQIHDFASLRQYTFTFRWLVLVSMPSSWVSGDLLAARLRTGEVYYSMVAVVVLLGWWLFMIPLCTLLCLIVSSKLRHQRVHPNPCLDHIVTFMGAGFVVALLMPLLFGRIVLSSLAKDDLIGTGLWALVLGLATLLAQRIWARSHLNHL